jgi:anti-sigma-K factor RskA
MRENSDRNTYDSEARINELLNSYIDGELATDQQTEVEELIARDAGIAQRLRQLQKCKTLLNALPRAEAPPEVLEGIKTSLAARTLQTEKSISNERLQRKYPRARRVLAAAAMIGLAAVLTTVMRTMDSSQDSPEPPLASGTTEGRFNTLAPREFSGRLELRTSDLVAVSASVNKAIESIHHSEAIGPARRQERRIYTLSCSKEEMKSLLTDLESMWPMLDSATLSVNTEVFGERIVVDTVTTGQVAKIVEQDHPGKRIEMARDFAALNNMALLLPGRAIATAIEGQNEDLIHQWRAPKPSLAGPEDPIEKTLSQPKGKETVHLTIVVSW